MKLTRTEKIQGNLLDPDTGEVKCGVDATRTVSITKNVDEENYIKLYYDTYLASIGANRSYLSPFLIELGKRMSYSKQGQVVTLIKSVKEEIAESLGVSYSRVCHMITECVDRGLLVRASRAVYSVSPMVMAKGDWEDIMALQITYYKELRRCNIEVALPKYLQDSEKWELHSQRNAPTLPGMKKD